MIKSSNISVWFKAKKNCLSNFLKIIFTSQNPGTPGGHIGEYFQFLQCFFCWLATKPGWRAYVIQPETQYLLSEGPLAQNGAGFIIYYHYHLFIYYHYNFIIYHFIYAIQPETQYLLLEGPLAQNGTRIYKYFYLICVRIYSIFEMFCFPMSFSQRPNICFRKSH